MNKVLEAMKNADSPKRVNFSSVLDYQKLSYFVHDMDEKFAPLKIEAPSLPDLYTKMLTAAICEILEIEEHELPFLEGKLETEMDKDMSGKVFLVHESGHKDLILSYQVEYNIWKEEMNLSFGTDGIFKMRKFKPVLIPETQKGYNSDMFFTFKRD